MSFSAPKAPDPTATANTQMQYNTQAAQTQNKTNSYNQETPFGSVSYVADASSPSGYRVVTNTGAAGQPLLNAATSMANNAAGMYSTPQDITGKGTADKLNKWSSDYIAPIFQQQDSNLEAQLRSQGLTPGSEAYNNAKNLLSRNQGDFTINYLKQNQGQAYDQAVQDYQRPLETTGSLFQTAAPTGFQQTPTAQIQPANYQGAVQSNFENQSKQFADTWGNIAKLGAAGIGLAAAPFTGGTSLIGTMGGMFGGAPDYGQTSNQQIGGYSMPTFGRSGGW